MIEVKKTMQNQPGVISLAQRKALTSFMALLMSLCAFCATAQDASPNAAAPDYGQKISKANSLLKEGKLDDAQQAAELAIKANPANYLAYAVEAKIASRQGHPERARELIDTAVTLAPEADKDKVRQLSAMLNATDASPQTPSPAVLSHEDQLKFDGLMLILDTADKAQNGDDRTSAYRDFLTRSVDFAVAHPNQTNIWLMRAFACIELDYPGEGFLAGRHLKELGAVNSDDPKVHHVMAELESKGWLDEQRQWRDWSKWTTDQIQAAADAGDAEAEFALAGRYRTGSSGLKQDDGAAAEWFRKAADQGQAEAEFYLGIVYQNGWGVNKDATQAASWFHKAADQGENWSQERFAVTFQNDWGMDKDSAQALGPVYWVLQETDHGSNFLKDFFSEQSAGGANATNTPDQKNGSAYDSLDGVEVTDIDSKARHQSGIPINIRGALVTTVDGKSNAAQAGLMQGDVIEEIDHHPVHSADDAVKWSDNAHGSRILLRIWRPVSSVYLTVDNVKRK